MMMMLMEDQDDKVKLVQFHDKFVSLLATKAYNKTDRGISEFKETWQIFNILLEKWNFAAKKERIKCIKCVWQVQKRNDSFIEKLKGSSV